MTEKEQQIKDLETNRDKIKEDLLVESQEEKDKMRKIVLVNHLDLLQKKIDQLSKG